MTRRLLGVCLVLVALSGLTARATAKPPDLPDDQKITVTPLRVRNFESVLPVSDMPAATFVPSKVGDWLRSEFVCPSRLWSCPAAAPEPWRSLDEVAQEEGATGSLLFGVGANSDCRLTGSAVPQGRWALILPGPAGAGRPVVVRLRPADRRVLSASVLFTAHPFLTLMPVEVVLEEDESEDVCHPQSDPTRGQAAPKPVRPRTSCDPAGEPLGLPQEGGLTCPYLREKQAADRHVRMLADEDLSRGVMENLHRLEAAATGLEAAKDLARHGRVFEAMACLEVVSELCPGSSFDQRVAEVWAGVLAGAYDSQGKGEAKGKRAGKVCPRRKEQKVERWLQSKTSIDCKDTPLQVAIKRLGGCKRVRVVFDLPALNEDGINLDTPIFIQLQDVSRKSALNLMLHQARLRYVVKDGVVVITTEAGARDEPVMRTYCIGDLIAAWQSDPTTCAERADSPGLSVPDQVVRLVMNTIAPRSWSAQGGRGTIDYCPLTQTLVVSQPTDLQEQVSDLIIALKGWVHAPHETGAEPAPVAGARPACPPSPKAQAMHARVAGVREQVDGLMKACHLAMADKRYEKAAELAREAHALDPMRVEADPLVYKMHLLAEQCGQRAEKPACPPKVKRPPCPAGPSNYPQKAAPGATKAPRLCPTLPPVDPGVVGALEEVVADKDALGRPCGASPAYEVERVGRRLDGDPAPQSTDGTTDPSATPEQKKAMAQVLEAVIEAFATDHPLGVGVAINLDGGAVRVYYTAPFDGEVYHLLYQGGFGVWTTPGPGKQEK